MGARCLLRGSCRKLLAVGFGALVSLIGAPASAQYLHREVLTKRIDETVNRQVSAEIFGTVDVVLGGVVIVAGASLWDRDGPAAVTWVVGAGLLEGAAASSLFMTRDTRTSVLEGIIYALPAVGALGLAVARDPGPVPRLTSGSLAAGYATAGALIVVDRARAPTRYSQLRAHQRRLEDPQDLTDQERRAMHQAMLGVRGPVPRWLQGLPLVLAGAGASAPMFDRSYGKDSHIIAGVGGGMSMLNGLLFFFPSIVDGYESDLKHLEINVAAAPSGLELSGSF